MRKNRRDSLLNGVDELERNLKYVKNKISENNLKQRIRCKFPKHETIDHLENVFVFNLERYIDQDFAEAYAAGLYDVNHLRNRWESDLTPNELVIERKNFNVFLWI